MINEDIRHIIEAELREGEALLWADKPQISPSGERGVIYLVMTTLIALLLFLISFISLESGNIIFDKYWPIVMRISSLIPLIASIREYLNYNKSRNKICYALTTKRLLILIQKSVNEIHEYTEENLYWLKPKMKKLGGVWVSDFGDIEIVPKPEIKWGQTSHFEDLLVQNKKIQNIPNVYRVMEMIFQNILSKESPYEQVS